MLKSNFIARTSPQVVLKYLPEMSATATTEILVFKTGLRYKKDIALLRPLLDADHRIYEWNVDMEDVDRVLRIASNDIEADEVIELVSRAGFACEELPD